jgi:putative flippase GtrA
MMETLLRLAKKLKEKFGLKLIRFGAVSAFNVVFGQSLLYGAQTVLEWPAVGSNVFSVTISAIPAYLLSRYWVWQKRGKNHLMKEVIPFWSLAILGFVLSTTAVWFVEQQWEPQPIYINLTNLAAFGVVWVSKFFILDRVLFKVDEPVEETDDMPGASR